MNLKEQVEYDLRTFFDTIDNKSNSEKHRILRVLLEKYAKLSQEDHLLDYGDLLSIVSKSKSNYISKAMPLFLGNDKKRVNGSDQRIICIAEATISQLNKNGCLKKLPKFDYKEDKL